MIDSRLLYIHGILPNPNSTNVSLGDNCLTNWCDLWRMRQGDLYAWILIRLQQLLEKRHNVLKTHNCISQVIWCACQYTSSLKRSDSRNQSFEGCRRFKSAQLFYQANKFAERCEQIFIRSSSHRNSSDDCTGSSLLEILLSWLTSN